MDIKEIVEKYLKEQKCDGLCDDDECYCEIEDLFQCDSVPCDYQHCKVAYKILAGSEECHAWKNECCDLDPFHTANNEDLICRGYCLRSALMPNPLKVEDK